MIVDRAIDSSVKSLKGKVFGEKVRCGWTAVSQYVILSVASRLQPLRKNAKSDVSFVTHVWLSVLVEQLDSHWTVFFFCKFDT